MRSQVCGTTSHNVLSHERKQIKTGAGPQFLLDFVEAENCSGFHAPQEAARLRAESIDASRQGQIALRDPSWKPQTPAPYTPATGAAAAATHDGHGH